MLKVKASAKPSKIHGMGLFADERIPKGTTTWKFDPAFDVVYDPAEVEKMPEQKKESIDFYAYLSNKTGKYIYSPDDSRFTNHSKNNNIDNVEMAGEVELCGVANRDIEIGEELLVNYQKLDKYSSTSKEGYLAS